MPLLVVEPTDEETRLNHAHDLIFDAAPELSAKTFLSRGQKTTAIVVLVLVLIGLLLSPLDLGMVLVGLASALYVITVIQRVVLTTRSLRHPDLVSISDEEARAVPDHTLPIYTVLVPLYREAAVVPDLIADLDVFEYPLDRLDVKLLVEQDDDETLEQTMRHGGRFDVIVVPRGTPQTKPRALNYGLTFATGEYVTVYDAEDRPDPLQLRRAVLAFDQVGPEVGCLQAQLTYWNDDQNLLTRLFAIEYLQWFRLLLPGLSATDAPIPLGGTSNHIRRSLVDEIGAWDPYNVTEDADLGIRLHRAGYRSRVLRSVTFEEANSDYVNWNNQRSRWYKGYLQTWLVHMRTPRRLINQVGWRGFFEFNIFVAGTPLLSLLNLVFWTMTLAWFIGHFAFIEALFPTAIYYPALFCFVFGNVAIAYLFVLTARTSGKPSLVWASCAVPIYWLMMGIAALKAFWQLIFDRSYWEKTVHGLAPAPAAAAATVRPVAASDRGDAVIDLRSDADPVATESVDVRSVAPRELAAAGLPFLVHRIDIEPAPAPSRRRFPQWGRVLRIVGFLLLGFALYVVVLSGYGLSLGSKAAVLTDPPRATPASGTYVAQIEIPSIGLDQRVWEGTGAEDLRRGVGHLRGTALPGQPGESVVIGHRIAAGGNFRSLSRVRVGNDVIVHEGGGKLRYRVTKVSVVARDEVRPLVSGPTRLTLVTGSSALNASRVRVVRARLVSGDRVAFAGRVLPRRGTVRIPGQDTGQLLLALVLLAFAGFVLHLRRRLAEHTSSRWVSVAAIAIVVVAVYAAFVAGTRALPPTF